MSTILSICRRCTRRYSYAVRRHSAVRPSQIDVRRCHEVRGHRAAIRGRPCELSADRSALRNPSRQREDRADRGKRPRICTSNRRHERRHVHRALQDTPDALQPADSLGRAELHSTLPPSCGWLFWDKLKNTDKLSFGDGELAWTNCSTRIRKYSLKWNGNAGRDFTLNPALHPTQKPVELHAQILNDFTQPDDVILDCFGGSGTTLIACEITGRTCLMMEISPEYCDVIINRYLKLTEGAINFAEYHS